MTAQALYRRWRSQTFDEIIGQDHIVQTLRNALRDDRIAHAYLFCGPRGTGKTSTARILAKAVNCIGDTDEKPCNRCHICQSINENRSLDLIEIDAASNRGIDEIRDLREKVNFAPSECQYKVYVVDEVHMLTREAFNALLKTLEEPPSHVIFILCTTEPYRIPATVLSRCQRHDFRRVSLKDLMEKMTLICEGEGIKIAPEAMELVARQATGSFRDAESLLDQLVSFGEDNEITLEHVQAMLGTASREAVSTLVDHLVAKDSPAGLHLINDVIDDGTDPRQFNTEILEYLHGLLLLKAAGGADLLNVTSDELAEMHRQAEALDLPQLVKTIKLFNEVGASLRYASQPQMPLELAFIEASAPSRHAGGAPAEERPAPSQSLETRDRPRRAESSAPTSLSAQKVRGSVAETAESPPAQPAPVAPPETEQNRPIEPSTAGERHSEANSAPASVALSSEWLWDNWSRLLSEVRPHNRMAEALLRSCRPLRAEGNTIFIGARHPFHRDKMEDPHNREVVEKVLLELTGMACRLSCIIQSDEVQPGERQPEATRKREILQDPRVQAARNMGGKVVDVRLDTPEDDVWA